MKKADALWASIVKREGKCVLCGSEAYLQAHHMITKGSCAALRYSLENGMCLCRSCHFQFHNSDSSIAWAHMVLKRPGDYLHIQQHKKDVCETKTISFYKEKYASLVCLAKIMGGGGYLMCRTGKVTYTTRVECKANIRKIVAFGKLKPNEVRAYSCPICGWFHMGHQGSSTRERLRRKNTEVWK